MATLAEVLEVQACILRKQINGEAQGVVNASLSLDAYVEQLIERAELAVQPALLVYEFVTGATPSSAKLDALTDFAESQFTYYSEVLQVANPELGPYEAIGRGLWQSVGFAALSAGKTDAEFVAAVYAKASDGLSASAPQIQHFLAQIDFFNALYISSGIPALEAAQHSRGAVLGQIVGVFGTQEASKLDSLAENFMRQCADGGVAVYGQPLDSIPDLNALPPMIGILATLSDPGGEIITGTERADIFRGAGSDINASDTLLGLNGRDLVELRLDSSSAHSLTAIDTEVFHLTDAYGGIGNEYSFSFENVSGLEEIHLLDFGHFQDVSLLDLQNNVAFYVEDFAEADLGGDLKIYFENGAIGDGAELALYLDESDIDNVDVYTYGGDFFSAFHIRVDGRDSSLNLDLKIDGADGTGTDDTLIGLYITGSAFISLTDEDAEFNNLKYIDLSGDIGGTYLDIDNSLQDINFVGGDGDDYLNIDNGFDDNDIIDGGDGDDTLEVDADEAVAVTAANVSNTEHLRINGNLSFDAILVNSAGFSDITLEDSTTDNAPPDGGDNLVLSGFHDIIIEDDQTGAIAILNGGSAVSITIDADGDDIDIALLDISNVSHVTFNVLESVGGNDLDIDTLDLASASLDTDTLAFIGSGDVNIDSILVDATDPLELVDLSGFTGRFNIEDPFAGETSFLVGNLGEDSFIELIDDDNSESQFVFGPRLDNDFFIEGFDANGTGDDTLDLGNLVNAQADLVVFDNGTFWAIAANSGQFAGTIFVEDNAQVNSIAELRARIEFDGALN